MKHRLPLATTTWDHNELGAIQRVIESGSYTMGKEVQNFEKSFADYIGSKYAVMSNSGSSANLLMTAALFFTSNNKLHPGDEVIVPAVSWSTTYYPLHQYGLRLRFVDIDMETLNYDLAELEKSINKKTRLIMVVNLLGNPNEFDQIKKLIESRNIRIIEDNCEAMGAELNGKKTGTFGIMGSFSTFFSHHISTMEGGLTVTDDDELFHILLCLRAHGWTRDLPKVNYVCGTKADNYFEESFRFLLPGYNLRPLEIAGAIGVEQVKKLPEIVSERRKNAEFYKDIMLMNQDFMIQREIGTSSWFGFSLTIRPGSDRTRDQVLDSLYKAGFECRPIVSGNFARAEVVKHLNAEFSSSLVNADHIDKNGLFFGNHHYSIKESLKLLRSL